MELGAAEGSPRGSVGAGGPGAPHPAAAGSPAPLSPQRAAGEQTVPGGPGHKPPLSAGTNAPPPWGCPPALTPAPPRVTAELGAPAGGHGCRGGQRRGGFDGELNESGGEEEGGGASPAPLIRWDVPGKPPTFGASLWWGRGAVFNIASCDPHPASHREGNTGRRCRSLFPLSAGYRDTMTEK